MRARSSDLFQKLQSAICAGLEECDEQGTFLAETWERPDSGGGYGGGGLTRILSNGKIFEKAGVNFSSVEGSLPVSMSQKLVGLDSPAPFFATGVSLVLHPVSPFVPTVHANYRYLEVDTKSWFGGGSDLTPYYLDEADARHFHQTLKTECDKFGEDRYPEFKKACDEYFYLPHRSETRGVGGIFFDYLGRDDGTAETYIALVAGLGGSFLESYVPIVERQKGKTWTPAQKAFHLRRRGRYVEFNLLYDRGTHFGLQTGGRVESIFMSFPPMAGWEYNIQELPGTPEYRLTEILKNPQCWVE